MSANPQAWTERSRDSLSHLEMMGSKCYWIMANGIVAQGFPNQTVNYGSP